MKTGTPFEGCPGLVKEGEYVGGESWFMVRRYHMKVTRS
jgi:hypothetical protein